MEEANERKRSKYGELVKECQSNGRRARCKPIEVGCRSFIGHLPLRGLEPLRHHRNEQAEDATGAARQRLDVVQRQEEMCLAHFCLFLLVLSIWFERKYHNMSFEHTLFGQFIVVNLVSITADQQWKSVKQ